MAVIVLCALGFVLIVLYAFSITGPHLSYLSVGLLTAAAALLTGSLAGLVVGIPRDVSSGALRATTSRARPPAPSGEGTLEQESGDEAAGKDAGEAVAGEAEDNAGGEAAGKGAGEETAGNAEHDAGGGATGKNAHAGPPATDSSIRSFETSTNLAEISDWLTKLLLGAGLVSLTRLGRPLGRLIDTVARGLGAHGEAPGAAVDAAAAILIGYVVLGFLAGYLATTLSYGKRLQAMFPH